MGLSVPGQMIGLNGMDDKKISVLMSAYNEPLEYVKVAVESILSQTYDNFEFIIVMDKPDNQELSDYFFSVSKKDHRVTVLVNEKNIGLAMSLNKALNASTGQIIARMDADDYSKPDRLERQLDVLTRRKLDILGCTVDKIDEKGRVWGVIGSYSDKPEDYAKLLPIQNVLVHPSIMIKREVITDVGGYRNFSSCQDYDLWLRLLSKGYRFGVTDENLFQFRRHRNSISATKRYSQFLNESYIRKLYHEREKNRGRDSFSEKRLNAYLKKMGFYDQEKYDRQNNCLIQYSHGISELKKGRVFKGLREILVSLRSNAVKENIRISLKSKKMRKLIAKGLD